MKFNDVYSRPSTLPQGLIEDLAELRKGTEIYTPHNETVLRRHIHKALAPRPELRWPPYSPPPPPADLDSVVWFNSTPRSSPRFTTWPPKLSESPPHREESDANTPGSISKPVTYVRRTWPPESPESPPDPEDFIWDHPQRKPETNLSPALSCDRPTWPPESPESPPDPEDFVWFTGSKEGSDAEIGHSDSSSSSSSLLSEPRSNDLDACETVATFGSPYQGHPPAPLEPSVLDSYHSGYIPHIIGEDDPFNPFSYDIKYVGEGIARTIKTPTGIIVAPVPRKPMEAALRNFEAIAMRATLPGNEHPDDKPAPPAQQRESLEYPEVIYETGRRMDLVTDMVSQLSLAPGPLKEEMSKMWQDAGNVKTPFGSRWEDVRFCEIFQGLHCELPQSARCYHEDRRRLELLHILNGCQI
ncbi:hypothetical protein H0H92_005923 [Tricholoma furcatifolium]|nr:hypothetical protein H0H92_005923 [Tricholoma furcatifolium]